MGFEIYARSFLSCAFGDCWSRFDRAVPSTALELFRSLFMSSKQEVKEIKKPIVAANPKSQNLTERCINKIGPFAEIQKEMETPKFQPEEASSAAEVPLGEGRKTPDVCLQKKPEIEEPKPHPEPSIPPAPEPMGKTQKRMLLCLGLYLGMTLTAYCLNRIGCLLFLREIDLVKADSLERLARLETPEAYPDTITYSQREQMREQFCLEGLQQFSNIKNTCISSQLDNREIYNELQKGKDELLGACYDTQIRLMQNCFTSHRNGDLNSDLQSTLNEWKSKEVLKSDPLQYLSREKARHEFCSLKESNEEFTAACNNYRGVLLVAYKTSFCSAGSWLESEEEFDDTRYNRCWEELSKLSEVPGALKVLGLDDEAYCAHPPSSKEGKKNIRHLRGKTHVDKHLVETDQVGVHNRATDVNALCDLIANDNLALAYCKFQAGQAISAAPPSSSEETSRYLLGFSAAK